MSKYRQRANIALTLLQYTVNSKDNKSCKELIRLSLAALNTIKMYFDKKMR